MSPHRCKWVFFFLVLNCSVVGLHGFPFFLFCNLMTMGICIFIMSHKREEKGKWELNNAVRQQPWHIIESSFTQEDGRRFELPQHQQMCESIRLILICLQHLLQRIWIRQDQVVLWVITIRVLFLHQCESIVSLNISNLSDIFFYKFLTNTICYSASAI